MNQASLLNKGLAILERRLPSGWRQTVSSGGKGSLDRRADAALKITAPDGTQALILIEVKNEVFPRDVADLKRRLGAKADGTHLIVARFLSPNTRRRLEEEGLGYLDTVGNLRLSVSRPGLHLETPGVDEDPLPASPTTRSLRGPKSGRLVRALCDFPTPLGISELASKAGVDVSYASRLVEWMSREDLLKRLPRGPVLSVDRVKTIRRWAQDYSVLKSNDAGFFLAPRGIDELVSRLPQLRYRYAVTGSLAANMIAPVAPPRLAMIYTDEPDAVAASFGLRPSETGGNAVFLLPFDPVVYERTWRAKGLTVVAGSQAAVDLLTSPGRGPSEAEPILERIKDGPRGRF